MADTGSTTPARGHAKHFPLSMTPQWHSNTTTSQVILTMQTIAGNRHGCVCMCVLFIDYKGLWPSNSSLSNNTSVMNCARSLTVKQCFLISQATSLHPDTQNGTLGMWLFLWDLQIHSNVPLPHITRCCSLPLMCSLLLRREIWCGYCQHLADSS